MEWGWALCRTVAGRKSRGASGLRPGDLKRKAHGEGRAGEERLDVGLELWGRVGVLALDPSLELRGDPELPG